MNGICKTLDCFYGAIRADDCDDDWLAVMVDRAGNQTVIGRYASEDEAEYAAGLAHQHDLVANGQFGVGA